MLYFELKKLYKRKIFLTIIVFSIIISFYNINKVSSNIYTADYMEAEESPYTFGFFIVRDKIEELKLNNDIYNGELLEEEYENLRNSLEDRRIAMAEALEASDNDLEKNKEACLKSYDTLLLLDYIINEYNIELSAGQKDSLEWNLKRLAFFMEKDTYELDLKDQMNLGRFFRFGTENLFGILSIIFLAFLSLDSLPREYESGTIVTPYTQPYKKRTIIFAKFMSFVFMTIVYIFSVIVFTTIFCKIKGYSLSGLNSISRVITDEMFYIKTWEYTLISIVCFLILNLLVYSFVLFIGSLTKNSGMTMVLVLTTILLAYIVTSAGYLQTTINPLYLINYSDILLGKYAMPFTAFNESIYKKYNSIGHSPYLYMLLPTIILLILSIVFQDAIIKSEKKTKAHKEYKQLSNLYEFELKKIKASNSTLFIFLISIMTIGIFFSIMIADDITMINKRKGPEGDVALRKAISDYDENQLKNAKEIISNKELPKKTRNEAEEMIEIYERNAFDSKNSYLIYKNIYQYYDEGDTENFYNEISKTIYYKFDRNIHYTFPVYKGETGKVSDFAFITSVDRVKELKKRNIKPILQTERQDTAYDEYLDPYKGSVMKKYDEPLTHSGLYSIFRINENYYLSYILLLFMAMFFCGGYTYETEKGNQLVLLYTEPINRREYHYTKVLSSILISTLFLILFYIAIILFGWVSEDFGDWNYPILHYDLIVDNLYKQGNLYKETYHFINLSTYILRLIIMSIFSIGFIVALNTFLSLKLKRKNHVVFTGVLINILGILMSKKINISILQMLLPFPYLNASKVANGSIKIIYNNQMMTLFMGICVLGLWIIILTALGMDISEKREVK